MNLLKFKPWSNRTVEDDSNSTRVELQTPLGRLWSIIPARKEIANLIFHQKYERSWHKIEVWAGLCASDYSPTAYSPTASHSQNLWVYVRMFTLPAKSNTDRQHFTIDTIIVEFAPRQVCAANGKIDDMLLFLFQPPRVPHCLQYQKRGRLALEQT
jgi:hypothetical protein